MQHQLLAVEIQIVWARFCSVSGRRPRRQKQAALEYAHAQGIIHRDLKPANMMLLGASGPLDPSLPLPQDVQVALTDCGVARLMDATEKQDIIVATPA